MAPGKAGILFLSRIGRIGRCETDDYNPRSSSGLNLRQRLMTWVISSASLNPSAKRWGYFRLYQCSSMLKRMGRGPPFLRWSGSAGLNVRNHMPDRIGGTPAWESAPYMLPPGSGASVPLGLIQHNGPRIGKAQHIPSWLFSPSHLIATG